MTNGPATHEYVCSRWLLQRDAAYHAAINEGGTHMR
jgi:hypothetical protein